MLTEHLTKKVDHLLEWKRANMLSSNPEYQRGSVWTTPQKMRLVDSVMRGYPIPLIDLHHIRKEVAGAQRDDFEIIDGQQRIAALHEFREGHSNCLTRLRMKPQLSSPASLRNCLAGGPASLSMSWTRMNKSGSGTRNSRW